MVELNLLELEGLLHTSGFEFQRKSIKLQEQTFGTFKHKMRGGEQDTPSEELSFMLLKLTILFYTLTTLTTFELED